MGTRGYHSYRGRGSTGKKVLAIVLGVILVAAGAFLLLQNRYVVYDERIRTTAALRCRMTSSSCARSRSARS